jgi:hypothetical protein
MRSPWPASTNAPQLFSWTVIIESGDPPRLGALGVSDDRQRAVARLTEALHDAPTGSHGVVHHVTVSLAEVGYWYSDPILTAELDPSTGNVVLNETQPRGGWGPMNALFRSAP